MKQLLLSILITLFVITSKAQIIADNIEKQMKVLKLSNIDTFLIYSFSCNGHIYPLDTCEYESTQYLFWMQETKVFLKRFDYCKNYNSIQLDTINPITFYFSNRKNIDKEQIKQATYYEIRKTKKGVDTLINTISVSHSCYHKFNFRIKNKSVKKIVDIYQLEFVKFDNGRRNIHYNYNQNTKQKKLVDIITNLLKELETEQKFKVE